MRCNCENLECLTCKGQGCSNEAGDRIALYVGALCDPCVDSMPTQYLKADEPKVLWDSDNECWTIKYGDLVVQFLALGELIVCGHDATIEVTYDQISEERGLRFQDGRRRDADRRELENFNKENK